MFAGGSGDRFPSARPGPCRVDVESSLALRLEAGPDTGRSIRVPPGGIILGRAAGPGRIVDPALEAHHLSVRVVEGSLELVQLAGRVPARIDGMPVGRVATARIGSTIDLGRTRVVVRDRTADRRHRAIVLGIGAQPADENTLAVLPFDRQAAIGRATQDVPIALDTSGVRRLLIVGPSAEALVRSVVAQAKTLRVCCRVVDGVDVLVAASLRGALMIASDPDPEAGWPGELPDDVLTVYVGVSWRAVATRRGPEGAAVIHRFHAAGVPDHDPGRVVATRRRRSCDVLGGRRPGRALVAQQVARTDAEFGGDVVGVPDAARCQRQAPASDAPVELIAQPRQQRDLFVEPRPP